MKSNTLQDAFYLHCGEQATGCGLGHIGYFGLEMGQNQHAVIVWDTFLKYLESQKTPVSRIIELGTGAGGFSVLLSIYCKIRGADFVTYDMPNVTFTLKHKELFEALSIDHRIADLNLPDVYAEVADRIQEDGLTLLLCDARKEKDWNDFSSSLKGGDYIAAHDYSPTEKYFWEKMVGKTWSFLYIDDERIQESCDKYHLESCFPEMFLSAAWVCKRRKI